MGYGGCYSFMKYAVFIINLIFWLSGLALIVLAVKLFTDPVFFISMPQSQFSYDVSAYLLISLGILLFIAGFFGCCGIVSESPLLLVLYFCVLLLVLVAEVSAGVWSYSYEDELKDLIKRSVKDTVINDYGKIESRTRAFDSVQTELHCCGADGPSDWISTEFKELRMYLTLPEPEFKIPPSCCATDDSADPKCINAIKPKPAANISDVIYHDRRTH
ncbi:CD151 antigen isoform X2 [Halyomorpha halys]|uniref:CD151 antigen isoform X2 n=1 Tax=Halyomorpha halys TaxID=286706 RepID=UPI0006D5298B|nr:CD151 antigen isoform X2 [Halyomorpha halys]